jgi:hypothetical protein
MEYILQNVPDYTEAKGAIRAKLKNGNLRLMLKKLKSINSKRPKSRKALLTKID